MLVAEKTPKEKGATTDYRKCSVRDFLTDFEAKCEYYKLVWKHEKPIFIHELHEKIAILDFDNVQIDVQLELCKVFFGDSIIWAAVSPRGFGLKVAVAFDENTNSAQLKFFLLKNFPKIDKKAISFTFNCYLPKKVLLINENFSRYTIELKDSDGIECVESFESFELRQKKANSNLTDIFLRFPQTSRRANGSVYKFMCSALRSGFGMNEILDFVNLNYVVNPFDAHRQVKNAINFLSNFSNSTKNTISVKNQEEFKIEYAKILNSFQNSTNEKIAISAPTGLGKTFGIVNNLKRFILAVPTIAIAKQTGESYKIGAICGKNNKEDLDEISFWQSGEVEGIVCTYDQLYRFDLTSATLVIDEAHELINGIVYRPKSVLSVTNAAKKAQKIIYISATLPVEYLKLIDVPILNFSFVGQKEREVKHYFYNGDVSLLIQEIKGKHVGKTVLIFLNNKTKIELNCDDSTVGIFNYEGLETSVEYNELIKNSKLISDFTIVTSKINAGVNISMPDKDIVCCYIGDKANQTGIFSNELCQFFGRIRNAKTTLFEIYERKKESEGVLYPFSQKSKKEFVYSQKQIASGFNLEEKSSQTKKDITDKDMLKPSGFDYHYCITRNHNGHWVADYAKIAFTFERRKAKSVSIFESLPETDNRYIVECCGEMELGKKTEKTEKDAEFEIALIEKLCDDFLNDTDKCKFVAQKTKNQLLRKYYKSRAIGSYDITYLKQQTELLYAYCQFLEIDFSHSQIISLIKGKTFSEIEKKVSESINYWFFVTEKSQLNTKQIAEKCIIFRLKNAFESKIGENLSSEDIIKIAKDCFGKHQNKYNLSLKELDINNIRKRIGFFVEFKYSKSTKNYLIKLNEVFFEMSDLKKHTEQDQKRGKEQEQELELEKASELEKLTSAPF